MKSRLVVAVLIAALFVVAAPAAHAQDHNKDATTRGTTGLFTVPLASVLGPSQFHVVASYGSPAFQPGDSSVETGAIGGGFAFAAAEGLEVFAAFEPRIGVHRRNISGSPTASPRLQDHPFADQRWQTGVGDLRIGLKYRFFGEPDAYTGIAAVGEFKLPTSDTDGGIGTGKIDGSIGVVMSGEAAEMVGLSAYVGGTFRSSPDEFSLGNSFDYGIGFQAPTRARLSAIVEFTGSIVEDPGPIAVPFELETTPFLSSTNPIMFAAGVRFSHESGVAADGVYTHTLDFDQANGADTSPGGWLAKLSYTNSRREPVVYIGAAPAALPPVNRPPTITCRAERTNLRTGESVRLFADVSDPDGDAVTVTWNTQAGSLNPREGETVTWSSQGVRPGSGPVSVRVSDGYGGTDDCELTLTVAAPPPTPQPTILNFSCSEFPSGNTRIDNRCKAILDDVALQMRQNPRATAVIAGHSDSAGADETNNRMALERADNAETYLVDTHGIAGNRINTSSAGSTEPIADNATAEGRLQNRRISVVVTIPAQ